MAHQVSLTHQVNSVGREDSYAEDSDKVHALEEVDRALFDQIAERYVAKDLNPYARRLRKLRLTQSVKNLPVPMGTLLEVGCGGGFTAEYLEGYYTHYVGVDYSQELINYAEKLITPVVGKRSAGASRASFVCTNIKDFVPSQHTGLPQKYDVIVMIGVLHHIPDYEKVLVDLKRFLVPGGRIVVNEPQRGNPFIGLLRAIRKRIDPKYSTDQRELSEGELVAAFRKAGYSVSSFSQGYVSTPFAETTFLPAFVGVPLSLLLEFIDRVIEATLGGALRRLSWNVVIDARA